jgi:flagellar hook-length control protein FliK
MELLTQSIGSSVGAEKSSFQQAFLKPSEQIIDRIQTTITGPVQQIRVTLSPEELGTVRITFRQTDGQMEGLVEVQNSEVRKEVEKALPQIAAALTESGIQVRRIDVASMSNQQQTNQEPFQSPGRDFGTADQYYSAGQGGSGSPKGGGSAGGAQQFAEQADSSQSRPRQTFDLAGLNMYA